MHSLEEQIFCANRLKAIAEKVGFTLWQLQELEGVLAQYYVLIAQAEKGMGMEAGQVLTEKALSKTFGSTITNLNKEKLLPIEFEERFKALLLERNWLVHNSKASSRSAVYDDLVCQKFLDRLDLIADETLSLIKTVGKLVETYVISHNVSLEFINEMAAKILKEWHLTK